MHLDIGKLARLTDRQLVEIYAHPRDKDGNITLQDGGKEAAIAGQASPSLESELRDLNVLASMFRMPQEDFKAAVEKLKTKWSVKEEAQMDG